MSELYRKWGRSVRREGSRLVRVDEAGEAMENRTTFRTQPIEDMLELEAPDAEAVQAAAREIESIVKPPLIVERLFVSEGTVAKHVRSILAKLDLEETEEDHRRVLAVIAFLDAH